MNKFGMVLGVAAVATLAGCKDPDYARPGAQVQNEVRNVDTTPVAIEPAPVKKCQCPPGTKHTEPCRCGAPDCRCIVEQKPVIVVDVSKPVVTPAPAPVVTKPAEPAYTIYVVQNGDYLAKISKKFNVTIASIKRLNPSIKKDVIRVGQKLKLPGKLDVGVQQTPVAVKAASTKTAKVAKKSFDAYKGATQDYVVKSGDTLGSIAYGNGCNIRQLKEMNGLTKDVVRIGQKLKIPAAGTAAAATVKTAKTEAPKKAAKAAAKPAKAAAAKPEKKAEEPKPAAEPVKEEAKPAEAAPAEAPAAAEAAPAPVESAAAEPAADAAAPKPAEAAPSTTTYVVQEGDDMTGVSIRWGVSAAEIRELNNLGEKDQLVPGQIIKLPAEAQQ